MVLLVVLVVNILIAPAVTSIQAPRHPNFGAALMLASFTALVVAAAVATSHGRAARYLALGIGAPALVLAWPGIFSDRSVLIGLSYACNVVFLALVIVLLVRQVFRARTVTLDVISASLCAYLLIGLAWASAYGLIELWQPDSFRMPEDGFPAFVAQHIDSVVRRVYFSFVTLLTLGYGDVVPASSIARLSTVIEAFVGQVFLVVLIARLVGIQVGQEMSTPPSSET